MRYVKPKFHYANFHVTSATSPRHTRDVPFISNSITPTSDFPGRGSFGEVGVMEFGIKGTSRVCRGRQGEVGIVEFGLYAVVLLRCRSVCLDWRLSTLA